MSQLARSHGFDWIFVMMYRLFAAHRHAEDWLDQVTSVPGDATSTDSGLVGAASSSHGMFLVILMLAVL